MLSGTNITLREFSLADYDAVHEYATDIDVVRFMEWGPNSPSETEAFLNRAVSQSRETPRTHYELAAVDRVSEVVVGGVGLHGDGCQAMLGYCFARSSWGRGRATEAGNLILEFGFRALGLHRIWARCDTENVASIRVLEKLGMREEGCLRHDCQIRGEWRNTFMYGILNEEWK